MGLPPHQEGCVHQEASGEEQEGQGRQVPPHSRREPYPQACKVLQADRRVAPHLEVRELHRFYHGGLTWRPVVMVCTALSKIIACCTPILCIALKRDGYGRCPGMAFLPEEGREGIL